MVLFTSQPTTMVLHTSIRLHNAQTGRPIKSYMVLGIAVSPDSTFLGSVGGDRVVFYWDVTTCSIIRRFQMDLLAGVMYGVAAWIAVVVIDGQSLEWGELLEGYQQPGPSFTITPTGACV
ncbi:hypothetical protein BY996DRAFT_6562044 [Phakopsora pachyrhizi]|uniref:Uncharacterized protein n=1 Tax=Phakopsora pachyrhizi TaxID=170000 RepID=A0AAV0B8D1_PHAPC|nr:hypothetical protein BY996DRAFT_6562044 [Phakopsora pachyrhizi]CAH7682074.1 hypothetical protein PPACK8108_LOCUS14776 [Phakopsora pachyrhizi]